MSGDLRPFELLLVGGPWRKRMAPRRAWIDMLPWDDRAVAEARDVPDVALAARALWTRTAFSEYASAAAFGELVRRMLACGAPIDLVAAAGDFVVDEIVHTEVAARLAQALGGAVALEVDHTKLVRPAVSDDPLVAAAEHVVRTCCVGEALTVPMLKVSRELAGSALVSQALSAIVADESAHAQIGWWFLDWAEPRLDAAARAHLAAIAAHALAAFVPLMQQPAAPSGLGMVSCDRYDPALLDAMQRCVIAPLAERGIHVTT